MSARTRRDVIRSAVALPAIVPSSSRGANERIQVALLGAGGRGTALAEYFAARKDAALAWICELHPGRMKNGLSAVARVQGSEPKPETVYKRLLERKDLDAVIVGTQDHWHALGTIWACQAGKDVYVEKPPSHTAFEGRKMVEAARRYDRVVQNGTQNRSIPANIDARRYIESGKLGDIHLCKVYNLKSGGPWSLPPDATAPSGLDWNEWIGPTKSRPYNEGLMNGGWHGLWEYCGGDLADDGIHQLDLAMMLLGDPWPPKSVSAVGGRYAFQDAREVPDVQSVWYDFHRLVLTMEMTNYPPYMDKIAQDIRQTDAFPYWPQCSTRVELYGSKGLMVIGVHGGGWQVFGKPAKQSRPGEIVAEGPARPGDVPHIENFLSCIRSRSKPNADIELGHKSMMLVHMGNIAHRVGNAKLAFDARGERFPGNDAANRLLHRKDRAGWEVPERV